MRIIKNSLCHGGGGLEIGRDYGNTPEGGWAVVLAGLEAVGGGGPLDSGGAELPAEYFAPEASATFWTMPSGVRSRSDRAVIWT